MALSYFKRIAARGKRLWQPPRRRPRIAPLGLEALQERIVPSLDVGLAQGILSIHADADPHQVQVLPTNQGIQVLDSGQPLGTFATDQVQLVTFQYGSGLASFDNETGLPDKQLRLADSGPLTPDQLSQTGNLDALLIGDTITLTGPSGAGFQITGTWSAATTVGNDGLNTHTFTASGLMALHTGLGLDFPFVSPDSDPLTVTTAPNALSVNFGTVASTHWSSGNPLDTTDPNSALSSFSTLFGLQVTSTSPQFGVALGRDLGALGAPLNPALPYMYFTTPDAQAQFGDRTAAVGPTNLLTVVLDPADPFLYARTNEFSVGVSFKGDIPFTPHLTLPDLGIGPLYGNVYARGSVSLGDVPVSNVNGEVVLNLDAQHDGLLLSAVLGDVISYATTGRLDLSNLAQSNPNDLEVGINGHADLHYNQGGFALNLPVDATAEYVPGRLVAHGTATGALFSGTPLSFLAGDGSLDVVADVNTQGVHLVAADSSGALGGFSAYGLGIALGDQGISATATLHLQYPTWSADVGVTGSVQADGTYSLDGRAQAQFAGFGSANAHFVLSNSGLGVDGDVAVLVGTQTATVHFAAGGYIHTDGQFNLTGTAQATFSSFTVPNATFTLNNSGLTAQGTVNAQFSGGSATLPFTGYVHADGQFNVTGTATGQFSGFTLTNGHFTLNNAGLTADGDVGVRLGPVTLPVHFTVVGVLHTGDGFSLDGHATATLAGFVSANADFVLNSSGLTANGAVDFHLGPLAYSVPFTGYVHTDGQYQLTAHVAQLNFGGFGGAAVTLVLNNAGLTATASVQLGSVVNASLTGTISNNGQYSLTGSAHVTFAGFGADAGFTLTGSGVTVSAMVAVPAVGNVRLGGSILTNGQYTLMFSGSLGISGFTGSGWIRLDSSGVTAHLDVGYSVLGLQAHLDGYIHTNGQYQLTGSAALHLGPIDGSLSFTLNNSGFHGQVHAGIDLHTRINGPFGLHLDVGFRVAVDASFNIATNGTFNVNGNFTATAYAGVSLSVGIGFSLDNHTFTIRTHDIGFSVWGIGFHPFGDIVVHY